MVQYSVEQLTVFPRRKAELIGRRPGWFIAAQATTSLAVATLPVVLFAASMMLQTSMFGGHSLPLLAAVGIWTAVVISTVCFGRGDEPRLLVLLRSVAMGAAAATAPLLARPDTSAWLIPISLTALLAMLAWGQIGTWLSTRLQTLIRAALVFSMFWLGGAIALRADENRLRAVAAVTVAWTLLALSELAMGHVEGQPMRVWTGTAQLSLATAPGVAYLAGPTNNRPAALYCTCVGVGLLVGKITEQRQARNDEHSELARLQLHSELEAIRSSVEDTKYKARIHDQTAALFTVESVMNLLQRGPTCGPGPALTDAAREELLNAARDEVARARRLVTDTPLSIKTHDLRELLEPPMRLMSVHAPNLEINIRPDMKVLADGDALVDAVRNLVFNAIEHGRGQQIFIGGRATYTGYEIVVSDEGPGIPEHLQSAVFQRGVGSIRGGHGLPNARTSVEQMGGTLELHPSPHGAHFRIELRPAPPTSQSLAM